MEEWCEWGGLLVEGLRAALEMAQIAQNVGDALDFTTSELSKRGTHMPREDTLEDSANQV